MSKIPKALSPGEEAFAVGILVDCKDVINEIPDAKTLVEILIDEIGVQVNLGLLEPLYLSVAKGLFEKYGDTPQLEKWFADIKARALSIIEANVPKDEVK